MDAIISIICYSAAGGCENPFLRHTKHYRHGMIRSLFCFGGVIFAAAISLSAGLQLSGKFDVVSVLFPLPEVDEAYQRGFRSDAMVNVNRIRIPLGVEEVGGDESIQELLHRLIQEHPNPKDVELDFVFERVQNEFPGAQYLAANLVTAPDRDALLSNLTHWTASANSDFDTINTAVFTSGRRYGALAVMSRRIPQFSLLVANERGGKFFNQCPHCAETHALELERESRTLILSCPYCDLPFDVLALDTVGNIRRASDFFEGFELIEPENLRKTGSPEERVVAMWQRVADRCDYQLDHHRSSQREVWKTPSETWNEKAGDCEDTSLLLADALLSAGFEARVAIGWNGNIGQHAWVVVRVEDRQYVIETTLQENIAMESLVPAAQAADYYQPEQLFDRGHLYYTTADREKFAQDYFCRELWESIPVSSESAAYSFR